MLSKIPVITIDGPGGTGKGTIAQLLAQELGWHYLDSGALYRVLALAAEKHGIALEDETNLATLAQNLDVQFDTAHNIGEPPRVLLEGEDVGEIIRNETYGGMASHVAALRSVRQALLERQRNFRIAPGLVTDGRDMGSVIFPDATIKFFLLAAVEERARRRYEQLKARGISVSLAALCGELAARDERDRERSVAPLKPAKDAVIIDTTQLTVAAVLQRVRDEVCKVSDSRS
jgi:cytidylate kinase